MKKVLGILGLLIAVSVATAIANPQFLSSYNLQNVVRWTALFGILSLGAAFVIVAGGIDLSTGSVVGLVGCLLPWLLVGKGWPAPLALVAVMAVALFIGFIHGWLVTGMKLQPFIVTLCGLLFYRGIARWFTDDQTLGFGNAHEGLRKLATGHLFSAGTAGSAVPIPVPFLFLVLLAVLSSLFLNRTVWGRHLQALGRNETAARYAGIRTHRLTILAYVLGSGFAGFGGILFALDLNSIQPASHGNFFELYAIAAAVLGGCSLRGGEGSILGVVLGAATMRVLYNSINILSIPTQLELAIIGAVILAGVLADELVRRAVRRRARPT